MYQLYPFLDLSCQEINVWNYSDENFVEDLFLIDFKSLNLETQSNCNLGPTTYIKSEADWSSYPVVWKFEPKDIKRNLPEVLWSPETALPRLSCGILLKSKICEESKVPRSMNLHLKWASKQDHPLTGVHGLSDHLTAAAHWLPTVTPWTSVVRLWTPSQS